MRHFTKIVIFIVGICLAIHGYYSFTEIKQENILNPKYWENPYMYFEGDHWVRAGNIELRAFNTKVFLFHPENFFGFSYKIDTFIRYKPDDSKAAKQIYKIRKIDSFEEIDRMKHAEYILSNTSPLPIENFLFAYKDDYSLEGSTSYPKEATSLDLQFKTGFIPPKYLEFIADNGDKVIINTNPLFIFRSTLFKVLLISIMIIIYLYLLSGFANVGLFLLIPSMVFIPSDYLLWYFFLYLFVTSVFMSMKIRYIQPKSIWSGLDSLHELKYIFPILTVCTFLYVHDWSTSISAIKIFRELFNAFVYSIILSFFLLSSAQALYFLYFHFRYVGQVVENVNFTNPRQYFYTSNMMRRLPIFFCDLTANENIKIEGGNIQVDFFRRLESNKPVSIQYYKTDGRGNYIFY